VSRNGARTYSAGVDIRRGREEFIGSLMISQSFDRVRVVGQFRLASQQWLLSVLRSLSLHINQCLDVPQTTIFKG